MSHVDPDNIDHESYVNRATQALKKNYKVEKKKDASFKIADASAVEQRASELAKEEYEGESALNDWCDENYGDAIDEVTLMALIQISGAEWHGGPFPTGITVVRVGDHVFEAANGSKEFEDEGDFDSFISNILFNDSFHEYYGPIDEEFNNDFWESPPPLLHGTNDLEAVLRSGLAPSSDTRGIDNRSVGAAVFTTTEESIAEEYGSSEGGGIVRINTEAMKKDGDTPFVAEEPPIVEYEYTRNIAHHLGMDEYEPDIESGMDPNTVIVHGKIDPKYLTEVTN